MRNAQEASALSSARRPGGVLVYVIGASGAGKDTLIAKAGEMPSDSRDARPLHIVRRHITRPFREDAEKHFPLTELEFAAFREKGAFAMHWESHGFHYGIGKEIDDWLDAGAVVIVNGSRTYLPEAMKRYPLMRPVLVDAHPDILRERLLARRRETPEALEKRLGRALLAVRDDPAMLVIDNSGPLREAASVFCRFIRSLREDSCQPDGPPSPAPDGAPEKREIPS